MSRWDSTPGVEAKGERKSDGASSRWDATPLVTDTTSDLDRISQNGTSSGSRWDATPLVGDTTSDLERVSGSSGGTSRWDATPVASSGGSRWDATPMVASGASSRWDATPMMDSGTSKSAGSRWDATPMVGDKASTEQSGSARPLTDVERRNLPITDEELDAMFPPGYVILPPPESYKPIRTPARKVLATPAPMEGGEQFYQIPQAVGAEGGSEQGMQSVTAGDLDVPIMALDIPLTKDYDRELFASLAEEVDESTLSSAESKERFILTQLLKIKNGNAAQRRLGLRTLTKKASWLGAQALFDVLLPMLMKRLEDYERHLLVKVVDRVLFKLGPLVRPHVHPILVVVQPLLIDESHYARAEARDVISNLAKAVGLGAMVKEMRPHLDSEDEYVRNTISRAFAVVASTLGVKPMLRFLSAVCVSKKSWQARHSGIKIVQQLALLMRSAVLPHMRELVLAVQHGLTDQNVKVRSICALALSALAEAAYPYGIEAFDPVIPALWTSIVERRVRGKNFAAFLKAIGFIIPLMPPAYGTKYTQAVLPCVVEQFTSHDKEVQRVLMQVLTQCIQSDVVDAEYVTEHILGPFFQHFWTRRTALENRIRRLLISTTVTLAEKVGGAAVLERIVLDLKDPQELFRRMTMDTIKRIVKGLGVSDVNEKLEKTVVDGVLFAYQEESVEESSQKSVLEGIGALFTALGRRARQYLPQVGGIIKYRLNSDTPRIRQQAADLTAKVAPVFMECEEQKMLGHLGTVLFECLGEEYPEVLGSLIGALHAVVAAIGMEDMTPPIETLLRRLTPILRNQNVKVQENCISLIGLIADKGAEHGSTPEWRRICFELLEMLRAPKKAIRRATVNNFGFIAKAIGPADVIDTLLNNLRVQDRKSRVCTTVAIAIVADVCSPSTVLPALMNEYRVPKYTVQKGVLKSLSFLFEYISEQGKDYVYAVTTLLEDALTERDPVHRQTAAAVVKHMTLGAFGQGREDAIRHLMNFVWPNLFEPRAHLIANVLDCVEAFRVTLGPCTVMQYLLPGLFHPARFVRNVYWKAMNALYNGAQDALVAYWPRIADERDDEEEELKGATALATTSASSASGVAEQVFQAAGVWGGSEQLTQKDTEPVQPLPSGRYRRWDMEMFC